MEKILDENDRYWFIKNALNVDKYCGWKGCFYKGDMLFTMYNIDKEEVNVKVSNETGKISITIFSENKWVAPSKDEIEEASNYFYDIICGYYYEMVCSSEKCSFLKHYSLLSYKDKIVVTKLDDWKPSCSFPLIVWDDNFYILIDTIKELKIKEDGFYRLQFLNLQGDVYMVKKEENVQLFFANGRLLYEFEMWDD